MKTHKLLGILGALALFVGGIAHAQTAQPWDSNAIQWEAPTTCTSGQPISNCPVTGYRIERAPVAAGPWASVGTTPASALQFTHTSAAAGTNCYRVVAQSTKGDSQPSAPPPVCFTNTPPSGPPNPPTNLRAVVPVAYNVVPDLQRWGLVRGAKYGAVKLGAACDEGRATLDGYNVISRPTRVITPRPPTGTVLVAKCA